MADFEIVPGGSFTLEVYSPSDEWAYWLETVQSDWVRDYYDTDDVYTGGGNHRITVTTMQNIPIADWWFRRGHLDTILRC
jgi:hypothetical protein